MMPEGHGKRADKKGSIEDDGEVSVAIAQRGRQGFTGALGNLGKGGG